MTEQQTRPDQTGTWEVDWDALEQVHKFHIVLNARQRSEIIVKEYRRQQAAAGVVEVPLEFLVTMRNITQKYPADGSIEMVTEVLTRLIDRHAAAQEQP